MPSLDTSFTLSTIGHLASDYPDKFGIPRQPGLAPSARAILYLADAYDDPMAVSGLEDFEHLWLQFVFDRSPERWSTRVRPPRLGGNRRIGVFASRATHRPNRLGLSLVTLERVETSRKPTPSDTPIAGSRLAGHRSRVKLHLRSHDLSDATPILDIKPYLPWAEARGDARAGFAPTPPTVTPVAFTESAMVQLAQRADGDALRQLIEEVLAQDPRPAYHASDPTATRDYGVCLRDVNVRFRAVASEVGAWLEVFAVEPRDLVTP
ncbi:tRNA (N6-threonylcarbamoyladenosine(37)-N6)-methyltransferase TrmO [Salinicola aestuarinus]|uniref:tRNA (N6-threonylcarbamoyladenosine(37)-N6)-methyltransferase TrmO n=1 Tax=Salinicola aestuarinus TaxID=1949082 RepID=UPI000DA24D44|nr:tRNA (N6-threonylcarbamoyladenosine(37)-N6)-methyltransferase TrmO [Salinicola aestuarinus]